MTGLQILGLCIFMLLVGVAFYPILGMFKDKKIDSVEKELIQSIVLNVIKDGLKLYSIQDEDSLKTFCVNKVMEQLQNAKITQITQDEVEIVVNLAFVNIDNLSNK
jgi:uncharacterized protein (UPF0264 family)